MLYSLLIYWPKQWKFLPYWGFIVATMKNQSKEWKKIFRHNERILIVLIKRFRWIPLVQRYTYLLVFIRNLLLFNVFTSLPFFNQVNTALGNGFFCKRQLSSIFLPAFIRKSFIRFFSSNSGCFTEIKDRLRHLNDNVRSFQELILDIEWKQRHYNTQYSVCNYKNYFMQRMHY